LLAALDFTNSTDSTDTTASKTANYCNLSNQPGLALIGAMARSATVLANIANLGSCSAGDLSCAAGELETKINDIVTEYNANGQTLPAGANKDTVTAIVTAVQSVYSATCGSNSGSSDICGPIDTALATHPEIDITTTDPAQLVTLGLELLQKWK